MFAQSTRPLQEPRRIGLAFLTALALHAGALLAVTLWQSQNAVSPPGEQEITIDLAPAMENIESIAPAEVSAPEVPPVEAEAQPLEPPVAEAVPIEEPVEETALEMTEATEVEAVPAEESIAPEAVPALAPSEIVVARPLEEKPAPKPVRQPPEKVERKPAPKPRRVIAERSPPPANARRGQASSSRENMQGSAASADPNVLNRYVASLAASLRSRLRYPEQARSQGISGVATVRFSMDRSGRIIGATIARSAGHPMLDNAALAAARPGSSLPAAPAALPQQQFTFSVPLRFSLR
ncbi:energy transducer TonB family protein [Microvirga makkahensis]|uniref:Protein TonB n=1 Tax=Microvirga makkahensis TaxID=1128670 RepID=A0A7X3MQN1_9HYPH|nr:energy transducer TonB [Microvirga makkahensis]MXQ11263.1 TonB family protein [Microvirga makkahensis]